MRRKMKTLRTLIRMVKNRIEIQKKGLNDLYQREAAATYRQQKIQEVFKKETEKITQTNVLYTNYAAYKTHTEQKLSVLATQIKGVQSQIEKQRDVLAESYAELKRYEITLERTQEALKQEAEKKEQQFIDEVALQKFKKSYV